MSNDNEQVVLIVGESAAGKTASLRNFRDQPKKLFLNCEAGKKLPFRNQFDVKVIVDPKQILGAFDHINPGGAGNDDYDTVIIDSATFMMDMYESVHVIHSNNTMAAWGDYNQFFKELMQQKVAKSDKAVVMTAHTLSVYDEKAMEWKTSVPVKGALKGNGIEAYFNTIIAAKKVTIKEIEKYNSDLLNITDQERALGFKYVFQTQYTKTTTGERIRSPMGLFTPDQTYIDNDVQLLLDHLHAFYN